ncbi:unannotated protein [freshwater metagenome]|uniref:Unannotated protein n=1 Tax=freshwater metagenome TaxID=449393 RepID=A0A6J7FW06_9ZZZZ|nr:hypothetical protein [Actinomycetota bacterium]
MIGDLTIEDRDGDALKLVSTVDGWITAKTVHEGQPDRTRVFLTPADQQRIVDFLTRSLRSSRERELEDRIVEYLANDGSAGRYDAGAMIAARDRLHALLAQAPADDEEADGGR